MTKRVTALLDSGAEGVFLHPRLIKKWKLQTCTLDQKIWARNVDGSTVLGQPINQETSLLIKTGTRWHRAKFLIAPIGREDMILGYPWLRKHNPNVNWQEGTIHLQALTVTPPFQETQPRSYAQVVKANPKPTQTTATQSPQKLHQDHQDKVHPGIRK